MTFFEKFTNPLAIEMLVFGVISILPTLVYIAFFDKSDDGAWTGLLGYHIIKLLRWFR